MRYRMQIWHIFMQIQSKQHIFATKMGKSQEVYDNVSKGLKERIGQLAEHYGCSVRKLEEKCQVGRGNFSRTTTIIGFDKVAKIIENCPEVSGTWLLTGKGKMFNSDNAEISNQSLPAVITVDFVQELVQTIKTQAATLLEQQRFINDHFGQEGIGCSTPPQEGVKSPEN